MLKAERTSKPRYVNLGHHCNMIRDVK
ncbi:hypothetical protein IM043_gp179 [Bacillus phage SPG24]|nr:hypothetical protein IM043_gp179 [Bacillus phage SPG24]